jgi:hypothetical protein
MPQPQLLRRRQAAGCSCFAMNTRPFVTFACENAAGPAA